MKKVIKIALMLIKLNFLRKFIYTFDSLFTLFNTTAYMLTFIWSLEFTYDKVPNILGFSLDEMYVILLISQIWWYLHVMLVRKSFRNIETAINTGGLQMFLLKPMPIRWLTSFLEFDFRHVPPVILVCAFAVLKAQVFSPSAVQWFGAIFFMVVALNISYSILSICVSMALFSGRAINAFDILIEFANIAPTPIEFFPKFLKYVFMFFLPAILIANPSFEILKGNPKWEILVVSLVMGVVLRVAAEVVWKEGVKRYSGVN